MAQPQHVGHRHITLVRLGGNACCKKITNRWCMWSCDYIDIRAWTEDLLNYLILKKSIVHVAWPHRPHIWVLASQDFKGFFCTRQIAFLNKFSRSLFFFASAFRSPGDWHLTGFGHVTEIQGIFSAPKCSVSTRCLCIHSHPGPWDPETLLWRDQCMNAWTAFFDLCDRKLILLNDLCIILSIVVVKWLWADFFFVICNTHCLRHACPAISPPKCRSHDLVYPYQ